uniref:Cytochrome c oxidase subunit 2 n=1 Tax=Anoplocephala magna TaxID=218193 RepID=A0A2Z1GG48_9CEST|nr:cytochrome c oxidase subunit II [Anoplocephala magna]AMR73953.1 cytochrome c oxidase subunit II [Anoplocephala magna]
MNLSLLYYDIVCYILAVCVFIICFVYLSLLFELSSGGSFNFGSENQVVELIWTIVPTVIVLVLCALNVNFITSDLDCFSSETIKVVGHQWYWSYEYSGGLYDSFPVDDKFLVDKPLQLFYGKPYHLVFTSEDVIHSFHVPSLNLKMDAIPGRLNHLFFYPRCYGVFTGYCAELCGVNHSVMPIVVEVIGGD